jgi:tRNA threonylcarbamoyladenosine biosynthesis protein TsaE
MELLLESEEATRALGRRLGALLQPGDFIALTGDLGAGKTLLVKAIAEGAGAEAATSPTFAIVNHYAGRVPLQHLDLYRLAGPRDLFALGFDDLLAEHAATLVEWAERAGDALPKDRLEISLTHVSETSRRIHLRAMGTRARTLLSLLPLSG